VEKHMKVSFLHISGFCSVCKIGPSTQKHTHSRTQTRYWATLWSTELHR